MAWVDVAAAAAVAIVVVAVAQYFHLLFLSACSCLSSAWAIGHVILCVLTESISSSVLHVPQENALP